MECGQAWGGAQGTCTGQGTLGDAANFGSFTDLVWKLTLHIVVVMVRDIIILPPNSTCDFYTVYTTQPVTLKGTMQVELNYPSLAKKVYSKTTFKLSAK